MLVLISCKLCFEEWRTSAQSVYVGVERSTPEQGCPAQCLFDSQIQIKGSWVELHFSVVIHALKLKYQVSYQLKNRFKVFFSAEKNFLFL